MKEIMDTSLVEGYIFFFEVLDMVGKECQHILLAVIGFLAQCLVGQCTDAAVALQCALAYLEQHAQVLIVEKVDAFREGGLSFLRLYCQQQFVLTVEPFHQLLHPALEDVSCEQFHSYVLLPFGLPPVRSVWLWNRVSIVPSSFLTVLSSNSRSISERR